MKCNHTKENGETCEAYAVKDSEFCYFHNPDIDDEEKREAQSNGGKTKALTLKEALPELVLIQPSDAVLLIADTISRVRAGTLDIRTANCLGFLSDKLLKAFEMSKLSEKIDDIMRYIERKEI
jgi:hypothetical protein